MTLELYEHARDHAAERGIIIADTKFEFGSSPGAEVVLGDEVLTPDSSRFWPADDYEPGRSQASFDKQYVRDWLDESGWDHSPPGPELPEEVVAEHARPSTSRPTSGSRGRSLLRSPAPYAGRMNLFVCGLRRSGTTILYDALGEDPELRLLLRAAARGRGDDRRRQRRPRRPTRSPRPARCASASAPSTTPSCRSSSSTGAGRARRSSSSSRAARARPRAARRPARDGARRRDQGDAASPQARRARRARPRRGGRPPGPRPARGHRLDAARAPPAHRHLPGRRHLLHRPHRAAPVVEPADLRGADRAAALARPARRHPRLPAAADRLEGRVRDHRRRRRAGCSATATCTCGSRTCAPTPPRARAGSTPPVGRELPEPVAAWAADNIRRDGERPPAPTTRAGRARRGWSGWSTELERAGYAEILELEPAPGEPLDLSPPAPRSRLAGFIGRARRRRR